MCKFTNVCKILDWNFYSRIILIFTTILVNFFYRFRLSCEYKIWLRCETCISLMFLILNYQKFIFNRRNLNSFRTYFQIEKPWLNPSKYETEEIHKNRCVFVMFQSAGHRPYVFYWMGMSFSVDLLTFPFRLHQHE